MFGFLKPDPRKRLDKKYGKLLEQAMQLQRRGDIKGYAAKTAEAEAVLAEMQALDAKPA